MIEPFTIVCKWVPIVAKKIVNHAHHVRPRVWHVGVKKAVKHAVAHKAITGAAGVTLVCSVIAGRQWQGTPSGGYNHSPAPSPPLAGFLSDFSGYPGIGDFGPVFATPAGGIIVTGIPGSVTNIPVADIPGQPVPEPSSLAIMAVALIVLLIIKAKLSNVRDGFDGR